MRARLFRLVGATSSLILVAFLIPLALLVRTSAADRAMSDAIVETQGFAPLVATADTHTLELAVAQANAANSHKLTVFLPDGRLIGAQVPRSHAVDYAATGVSITADAQGGREVVVAVAGLPEGTAVIRTFVSDAELEAGVARAWSVLALLGLGLLGVSLLVANQLARNLTRPLTAVAEASYRLAHGRLGARAAVEGPPEVRQVGAGLNQLAGRITELLAQERETVADLSHRLRTPLTALRIDVESLADPQDRARLAADLDAVERTVNDVIREARRPVRDGIEPACDASEVVKDRVQFWSALAEEERRPTHVYIPPSPVAVRVSREDLCACVDALLGNVFAHTPEGGGFSVTLTSLAAGGGRLVVEDEGPGLPDDAMLSRGTSGAGSTGLGLDIVGRTAERSGGSVRVGRSVVGGASIELLFGPPQPPVIRGHRHTPIRRLSERSS
jgi:signal transduction histidine kinase